MSTSLPDKVWQSANAVTAFAMLQAIAFFYVSVEPDMQYALDKDRLWVCAGISFFHLAYACAVFFCHYTYRALVKSDAGRIVDKAESQAAAKLSVKVMCSQIAAIVVFGSFAFAITINVDWKDYCESYVENISSGVECKNTYRTSVNKQEE